MAVSIQLMHWHTVTIRKMNGIWYDHGWLYQFTQKVCVCTDVRTTYIRLCVSVSTCHFWFWLLVVVVFVAFVQWKMVNWKCLVYMHKIWNRWAHWHSLRMWGKEIQGIDIWRQTNKSCSKHLIPCMKFDSIDVVKSTFCLFGGGMDYSVSNIDWLLWRVNILSIN